MTIRVKVLIVIFAVILVAAGASTLIGRTISINTVEDEIGNLLSTTAQSKAHQIEIVLADKRDTAVAVAEIIGSVISDDLYSSRSSGALDSSFLSYMLERFKESDELIYESLVWDTEGTIIASTFDRDGSSSSTGLQQVFLAAREGPEVTGIHRLEGEERPVAFMAAPIVIEEGLVGVLGIVGGVEDILQIVTDRTGLGKTGEAYIVNRQGYMLSPSRFVEDALLTRQLNAEDFKFDAPDSEPQHEEAYTFGAVQASNYLGTTVLRAYTLLPSMNWAVVVEKGTSEAYAPVSRMTDMMLWILFSVLAVGAIAAFLLSRTITRPIVKLHQGVLEIMNGNLNHKVGGRGKDEIGQLSRAFDEMTVNLKHSKEELESYSTSLEEMVAQRTRELVIANEELSTEVGIRKKAEEEALKANAQLREAMEQLKASQAQLLQSEKLAAVGQLVSGVAHELNNPLMAISGYTELMLMYLEDEQARDDLHSLHELTKRATSVVRNLLSFARKQDPKREYISINDALESVIRLRGYDLKVDMIQMVLELNQDLPYTMADYQQLQQVFLNIVVNAEQAMKDAHGKGRLLIRTEATDDSIRVIFRDDGPGMPEDIKNRIFEPFFTTKEVGKGTGLGLSICYGIIQEHGGTILVESQIGRGTEFIIELPIVSEVIEQPS